MFKFEYQSRQEKDFLSFNDVLPNQFFISPADYLCQKCSNTEYNLIADQHGNPLARHVQIRIKAGDKTNNNFVKKIFPIVTKITWE